MARMDYSRISKQMLLENYIVGVGFLEGFVFLRALSREVTYIIYDPSQEIASTNLFSIPGRTFLQVQKFGSSALNSTNLFNVDDPFHVYQLWFGVAPSGTRVFTAVNSTDEKNLDEGNWGTGSDYRFGYVDGFVTPLNSPAQESEQWITQNVTYQWGVYNPYNTAISPLFSFVVNRLFVAVITDANLIYKVISGSEPARLAMIGGLNPPKYNQAKNWKVSPIQLNSTLQQIQAAVGGK